MPKKPKNKVIPLHSDDKRIASRVLFKAGFSFEQIVALLGISIAAAENSVREGLP